MIQVTDSRGLLRYVPKDRIAQIKEPIAATAWHGIRAIILTTDGQMIEARDTPEAILAQTKKPDEDRAAQRQADLAKALASAEARLARMGRALAVMLAPLQPQDMKGLNQTAKARRVATEWDRRTREAMRIIHAP